MHISFRRGQSKNRTVARRAYGDLFRCLTPRPHFPMWQAARTPHGAGLICFFVLPRGLKNSVSDILLKNAYCQNVQTWNIEAAFPDCVCFRYVFSKYNVQCAIYKASDAIAFVDIVSPVPTCTRVDAVLTSAAENTKESKLGTVSENWVRKQAQFCSRRTRAICL